MLRRFWSNREMKGKEKNLTLFLWMLMSLILMRAMYYSKLKVLLLTKELG